MYRTWHEFYRHQLAGTLSRQRNLFSTRSRRSRANRSHFSVLMPVTHTVRLENQTRKHKKFGKFVVESAFARRQHKYSVAYNHSLESVLVNIQFPFEKFPYL